MSKMSNGMKYGLGLLAGAVVVGVAAAVMGDDEDEGDGGGSSSSGDLGECGEATDRKTYRGVQYTVDVCKRDGKLDWYGVILLPMQPRLRLEPARADGPTADADAKAWIDSKLGGAQPPNPNNQHATVCSHLATLLINHSAAQGQPLTEAQKNELLSSCIANAAADPTRFAQASPCILQAKTWAEALVCLQAANPPVTTATFAGTRP